MPVTYTPAVKAARMAAVVTAIGASGKLKLWSSADALLATFTLAAVAGTVSGSVLTFSDANGASSGILNTTASGAGTAAKATITTSGDLDILPNTLTVGTTGTDVIIDNPTFVAGQSVTINVGSLTHA